MTTITPAQLAEWEALADAATAGPWEPSVYGSHPIVETVGLGGTIVADCGEAMGETFANGSFIAAAREAVPSLIAALQDTHARLDAVVEAVEGLHGQDASLLAAGKWCPACGDETPCATVEAVRKAAGR